MFCNQCGTELADNSKFCNNCGKAINAPQIQDISKMNFADIDFRKPVLNPNKKKVKIDNQQNQNATPSPLRVLAGVLLAFIALFLAMGYTCSSPTLTFETDIEIGGNDNSDGYSDEDDNIVFTIE